MGPAQSMHCVMVSQRVKKELDLRCGCTLEDSSCRLDESSNDLEKG
jgi:hypothetical protein